MRMAGWKEGLANTSLVACSVLVCLLLLEFVFFRFVLLPDDLLPNVTIDGVVRYAPGTNATFRHPGGRETRVTINAQGWNSTKPHYPLEKQPGRLRVVVIGDSYVHGAFVNVEDGFPALLENKLSTSGQPAEVFRFGMDGAPLSQYLHVLRAEVLKYDPDVVVVPLIHNDFDESYRFLKTRYASSFMKLAEAGPDRAIEEIPPTPFQPGLADRLRAWNTFRYVYYETGLFLHAKRWVSRYFWGGEEDWDPAFVSSAVDIRKIGDHARNRHFARYVLAEMKRLSERAGFELVFVMDAVRDAIYEGRRPSDYAVGRLNQIARELTAELGLPFMDLQDAFQRDYATYGQRFEFPYDWHWNERANEIVAREIVPLVLDKSSMANEVAERQSGSGMATLPALPN
jgi:hypothetical protein